MSAYRIAKLEDRVAKQEKEINKTMATLQEINAQLKRLSDGMTNIAKDIATLKAQIENMGLTKEQTDELLKTVTALADSATAISQIVPDQP